jgi:tRNA(Arg) A34 adenosine deaminase TadA
MQGFFCFQEDTVSVTFAAMDKDETLISDCYDLANKSVQKGNHPFGALLIVHGKVRLTAENTVVTENDVTRHAELNLVSAAVKTLGQAELSTAILYTSTEPCAMCAGAIYWAGIRNIVYGCSALKLGEIAGAAFVVPSRELLDHGAQHTQITGPVLEERGAEMHQNFWPRSTESSSGDN